MSLMTLVEPEPDWAEHIIVRLLRRWTACQALHEPPLPRLVMLAAELGVAPEAALAADSFFQIAEACLDRPLVAECCCSRALSRDERAVLMLLAAAPSTGPVQASATVPHGLPGVLVWAATSLRYAVDREGAGIGLRRSPRSSNARACPFATVS